VLATSRLLAARTFPAARTRSARACQISCGGFSRQFVVYFCRHRGKFAGRRRRVNANSAARPTCKNFGKKLYVRQNRHYRDGANVSRAACRISPQIRPCNAEVASRVPSQTLQLAARVFCRLSARRGSTLVRTRRLTLAPLSPPQLELRACAHKQDTKTRDYCESLIKFRLVLALKLSHYLHDNAQPALKHFRKKLYVS